MVGYVNIVKGLLGIAVNGLRHYVDKRAFVNIATSKRVGHWIGYRLSQPCALAVDQRKGRIDDVPTVAL